MPEISRFFGIVIRMFAEPATRHQRPHFHAYYQDAAAVFGSSRCGSEGGMEHPLHRVTAFEIVEPFVLNVTFDDRTRQRIDFRPVLHGELYGALRDAAVFERVAIDPEAHTLVWPNGANFDPATLHDWPAAGPGMIAMARRWADRDGAVRNARGDTCAGRIIGADIATEDARTGLALAIAADGVRLRKVRIGRDQSVRSILEEWLTDSDGAVLIAIDAPLGWPIPLAASLKSHAAGESLKTPADDLFRRATDKFIKREVKKTPLDVGADRIARTARAALQLLEDLRTKLSAAIPLAWDPADMTEHAVIEVHPAATLKAHGIRETGYRKDGDLERRHEIVEALGKKIAVPEHMVADLSRNPDLLDAAVCVLAAKDFVTGRAMPPPAPRLAEREGWIWTAKPVRMDSGRRRVNHC